MKDLKPYENIYVLKNNYVGYLSYIWKNTPYVIPITYYYNEEDHCILSYSGEGHKINAMRIHNSVSIHIADIKSIRNWQTVLVHGKFEELVGTHAKQQLHKFALGIKKIMFTKEGKFPSLLTDFSSKISAKTEPIVFRIKVLEITGKTRMG
ncbi:MAG: pyridoxamine 5'-phosphate oxidase family protein [Algibacter sp.]|uniref:pyridoxamine 5'-phosphate oxidase family protein n=1 Tax=Algibacter sp. TaxID=1872428 RepID=UPI00261317DA|nr:pyridoxamine 5'-phosphate oxidase family protein [Algibacter sp.]MDG1730359.1 pyridoxamine 5'-phosphate oxidase family protein [Algibacter sp.]MDG2178837.1 pyridoxamine 5'-phosphate oxidase family protein [Algibacter sp.]